jgi:hypothetical protein
MGVGLERVLSGVEETPDVDVRSTLSIHHLDVFGVKDGNTHHKLGWWFRANIPNNFLLLWGNRCIVYFNPHLQLTL